MKFLWLLLLVIVIGILVFLYNYNKPHQNIVSANPDFTISSFDLYKSFSVNEKEANSKYLDKVLLVKGEVREVLETEEGKVLILESGDELAGISCNLEKQGNGSFEIGNQVQIKGLCAGMLTDVVLVRCVIVKN